MKIVITLIAAVFFFQLWNTGQPPIVSNIEHENVVLYATSWCSYCKKTRAFLAENNVEYIEYDIEKSAKGRKQHEQLGGKGVPVLDVRGTVVYGYSVKKHESDT